MKKTVSRAAIVIATILSSAGAFGWSQTLTITNTVRNSGGTLIYAERSADCFDRIDFELRNAPSPRITEVGGLCINAYEIQIVGGAYANEYIEIRIPAGENWCYSRTLDLGTVAEIEKLRTVKDGTIYRGKRNMLAVLERVG